MDLPAATCGWGVAQYNTAKLSTSGISMEPENKADQQAPSLLSVLGSVLASMFGVQSSKKREQDFTYGKPSQYIIIGLLVTIVFILSIWGLVSLVMKLAGV
jgi:hypothetical protein